MSPPRGSAWKLLHNHHLNTQFYLRRLFRTPQRFQTFSLTFNDILYDFSKNLINQKTLDLLINLAKDSDLTDYIEKMFTGDKINFTENRAVLHTALRNRSNIPIIVDGEDVMPQVCILTLFFSTLVLTWLLLGE